MNPNTLGPLATSSPRLDPNLQEPPPYIYIYTHIYTYFCIHVHTHTHTYVYMQIRCLPENERAGTTASSGVLRHLWQSYRVVWQHICLSCPFFLKFMFDMYIYIYTYVCICIYIYIYIYIYICVSFPLGFRFSCAQLWFLFPDYIRRSRVEVGAIQAQHPELDMLSKSGGALAGVLRKHRSITVFSLS